MQITLKMQENRIHALFLACCASVVLLNLRFFHRLLDYSSSHEFASHIFLIPIISAFLIFQKREKIFTQAHNSSSVGIGVCLAVAVALIWIDNPALLTEKILAIIILFLGLFLAVYGLESFRKALFPLFFLFLMAPIPESYGAHAVAFLQRGSAEMVALLFGLTGTPFHREGMTFILPKVGIEIASQCSGIRSSIALLLSCLLAAHLILVKPSRKLAFVLFAIPMAMFKNAVRITTLSLLAIHVDTGFVGGSDLHRKGGIVFFITTLLLMTPILWLLRRSEKA
jgi:exosortase